MNGKLRSLCLAAALTAGTLTASVTATAAAADAACGPVAKVFTTQADGDLWLYEHSAPTTGGFSWAGVKQIGWGWGGKTFAGPDGRVYNITSGGELRRLRYNGSGWDTYPGGGQFQTIGWGWQKFVETANRGKITVAADGSFYTLEGDQLRWWRHDEQAGGWAPGSGRVLDVGWGRFDLIAASGDGGLQARDAAGALHRFRYHTASERFVAFDAVPAVGWNGRGTLFSPGGDIYYSVRPDTGELRWNQFTEDTTGWRTATGSVIGTGWGTDVDVTATTSDCSVALPGPAEPGHVGGGVDAPHVADLNSGGRYVLGRKYHTGFVTDWYDPVEKNWRPTWEASTYGSIYAPFVDRSAGTVTFAAGVGSSGVDLVTLRGGNWQATTKVPLRGAMSAPPTLVRRANGTFAVYALASAGDEVGHLYVREQLPNGDFLAWRRFGDPAADYFAINAITRGDETTVLATEQSGVPHVFRHAPGTAPVPAGQLTGARVPGPLTTVLDSNGTVLVFAVLRTEDGIFIVHVRREKADRTGFEETWQSLGEFGRRGVLSEPVSALLLPNGTVAVSVPADGKPYVTTSKGPGSTEFAFPWTPVEVSGDFWFNTPTVLAMSRTGEVLLSAESEGNRRHLFSVSVPADPATPLRFAGGPLYGY
ncbi:tachylectin-related carbohydrate-binding protein [Lentzea aerocolonigenes]|uniref:tachylectin-related carbohydrate-binding protein n=1 Tax=Lentzea aerocolonigenes TaxID=68170 RepID=UPI00068EB4A3|nr:tachylectin-related carbohydrate-binding protein [Lentzea aerocolonigenes]MCP2246902.1 Tachylectin [Lentzea aerocolonigenes]